MSIELYGKLKEIIRRCDHGNHMVIDTISESEAIDQIDKAFAEAGYIKIQQLADRVTARLDEMEKYPLYKIANDSQLLLVKTGDEFRTRLFRELAKLPVIPHDHYETVIIAANKAAGVETK